MPSQISDVEGKVTTETQKVKEMMGLIEKAKKPAVGKKADKKAPAKKEEPKEKKEEPKEEKPKADDKKKAAVKK